MHYTDTLVNVRVAWDVTSEIENTDKNTIGKPFPPFLGSAVSKRNRRSCMLFNVSVGHDVVLSLHGCCLKDCNFLVVSSFKVL